MNNIWNIAKKELLRFFTDKRMVFSTVLLPGLMIFVLYSVMGNAFSGMFGEESDTAYRVLAVNLPASVAEIAQDPDYSLEVSAVDSQDEGISQVKDENADLLVVFPADFDTAVDAYQPQSGQAAPDISIYYDSSSTGSGEAYTSMVTLLDSYESRLSNKFDINRDNTASDLAEESSIAEYMMSWLLPFLLIVFMFSACMAIVPESIAGEKERGTIATLLVTPLNRSHLAIGKIIALGIIALCSGVSSFLGTFLSLPKLFSFGGEESISLNIYGITDYLLMLLVIFSTLLLLVSLLSIISAFAKTVKEASTYVAPVMVVVMVVGLTGMLGSGPPTDWFMYLLPLYNSVQCLTGIFSISFIPVNVVLTILSNFVYTCVCVFIITRMFHDEKVIFSR